MKQSNDTLSQMDDKKKSFNLSDLVKESKPKKESKIHKFFLNNLTEEQKLEHYKKSAIKRKETYKKKHAAQEELRERARTLLPELVAAEILADEVKDANWIPKQDTIDKLKSLMTKNMTTDQMRAKYFKNIKDDTWHKLMKFAFRSSVTHVEDIGNAVFQARETNHKRLEKSLKEIEQQIRYYKKEKGTKIIPAYLLDSKHKLIMRIAELSNDYATVLHKTGVVGEKGKSPTLHLHMTTPRPGKKEKVVEEVEVE